MFSSSAKKASVLKDELNKTIDANKAISIFLIFSNFIKTEKYKMIGTLSEIINARTLNGKISFEGKKKLATK